MPQDDLKINKNKIVTLPLVRETGKDGLQVSYALVSLERARRDLS